jgi:hypothetical protein
VITEKDETIRRRTDVDPVETVPKRPSHPDNHHSQSHSHALVSGRDDTAAGPGPSTQAVREGKRTATERDMPPVDELNGRLRAHLNSNTSHHRQDDPMDQSFESDAFGDLAGQSGLVSDSSPDRAHGRGKKRHSRGDFYEISEEYAESTTVIQTMEQVASDPSMFRGHAIAERPHVGTTHPRMIEHPDTAVYIDTSLDATIDETAQDGWVEIDQGPGEDLSALPSIPNGLAGNVEGSAMDPGQSGQNFHVVLRTMTDRLLSRRRVVRRISPREAGASALDRAALKPAGARGQHARRLRPSFAALTAQSALPTVSLAVASAEVYPRTDATASATVAEIEAEPMAQDSDLDAATSRSGAASTNRMQRPSTPPPFPSKSVSQDTEVSSGEEMTTDTEDMPTIRAPPPTPHARSRAAGYDATSARPFPAAMSNVGGTHRRLQSFSQREGGFEHTSQCTCHTMSTESPPTHGTDTPDKLFPHDSLLKNIHRFMRFSSAAYGQNFLRILGMGSTDFTFPSTGRHHANTWSFVSRQVDCESDPD